MKKKDARNAIRRVWQERPITIKTENHIMLFYQELKRDFPELLKFRASKHAVDKYQIVKSFVIDLTIN